MVYTCAYFATPDVSLEQAQTAKLDYVCRKLQLKPGERVVEAGCGWGALALYMARHYGVTVKAYNISKEQVAFAREQAQQEGLDDRVEFIEDDWRNIEGVFDVFASVGMLEQNGFSVLDIENLRRQYAKTLEHWSQRYEDHLTQIEELFDETFLRVWRLYLAGSLAAITSGTLQLFQVLFSRSGNNGVQWARNHLYRGSN